MHILEFDAAVLHSGLTRFGAMFWQSPLVLIVAAFVLPIVLAAWSRRLDVFIGSLVMAMIAFTVMVASNSVVFIIAIGAYLNSLVLALSGIFAMRRDQRMRAELHNLRSKLDDLTQEYESHLLAELKTSQPTVVAVTKSHDEKTSDVNAISS